MNYSSRWFWYRLVPDLAQTGWICVGSWPHRFQNFSINSVVKWWHSLIGMLNILWWGCKPLGHCHRWTFLVLSKCCCCRISGMFLGLIYNHSTMARWVAAVRPAALPTGDMFFGWKWETFRSDYGWLTDWHFWRAVRASEFLWERARKREGSQATELVFESAFQIWRLRLGSPSSLAIRGDGPVTFPPARSSVNASWHHTP